MNPEIQSTGPLDLAGVAVATPAAVLVKMKALYFCMELELELELIQSHMTQKPMLRGEVGACRITQLTSTAKKQQNVL